MLLCLAAGFQPGSADDERASPRTSARPRSQRGSGLRGPAQKELIYVTLPGSLERSPDQNGNGIVVLDAKNNYNFVKRIPVFDVPASQNPEQIAGVTASPVTQMIYVAARGRLAAVDLTTDKKVWENAYDGQCCERPQISPDGSFMYVGSDLKDFWYVVNPKTGELITKAMAPLSPNAHNLNLSPDGKSKTNRRVDDTTAGPSGWWPGSGTAATPGWASSAEAATKPRRFVSGWAPCWGSVRGAPDDRRERLGLRERRRLLAQRRVEYDDRPLARATPLARMRWLSSTPQHIAVYGTVTDRSGKGHMAAVCVPRASGSRMCGLSSTSRCRPLRRHRPRLRGLRVPRRPRVVGHDPAGVGDVHPPALGVPACPRQEARGQHAGDLRRQPR